MDLSPITQWNILIAATHFDPKEVLRGIYNGMIIPGCRRPARLGGKCMAGWIHRDARTRGSIPTTLFIGRSPGRTHIPWTGLREHTGFEIDEEESGAGTSYEEGKDGSLDRETGRETCRAERMPA